MKPAILRCMAERDVEDAFSYYLNEAGSTIALGFVEALDQALEHIAAYPASGSTRYGLMIEAPALRTWATARFPYVIIYVERETGLDVLRVVHQQRDIPASLQDQ